MTFANLPQEYDAKFKRVHDAYDLKIPDRVPIINLSITWGTSYSKTKIQDVLYDKIKLCDALTDYCKELCTDTMLIGSLSVPLTLYDALKPENPQYLITADGYSTEHVEQAAMNPDEYPQLIADPAKFIENIMLPRRYPILNRPYPENYKALKSAYDEVAIYLDKIMSATQRVKERFGVPVMAYNGPLYVPMDFLFDFFRGFKGIQLDMRRNPDQVIAAADKLVDYIIKAKLSQLKKREAIFIPLHLASYMSVKQFEKFYWPSFKKLLTHMIGKGAQCILYLENDWTPYMDFLMEFPKGSIIAIIEYGDLKMFKKKYGSKIAIMGGMPCEVLRYNTKEECIKYTRDMLDAMAPGGGYLWTTDKILLSPGDVNTENYIASINTVLKYGAY